MISVFAEHNLPGFSLSARFTAPSRGITVLFGPSGAGKSTILAILAGLIRPDRLTIDANGQRLDRVAAHRRRIGMVFQDARLFPHRTVRDNLLYGARRAPRAQNSCLTLDETVALLGLQALLRRAPGTLSGGEQQRVAIGRALLSRPTLMLMDEPLSSLDAARQEEILPYLLRLKERGGPPILYVTHAMEEMARLADHVVLLQAGRVVAEGRLADLATDIDLPLAQRDNAGGVLEGFLHSHDQDRRLSAIVCGGLVLYVPGLTIPPQTLVRVRIPAKEVVVALDVPGSLSVTNILPATIIAIGRDEAAHAALVTLDTGGGQLLSRMTLDAADRLFLAPGKRVTALVKAMSVEIMPAGSPTL